MNIALSFVLIIFSFSLIASVHTARIVKLENSSEIFIPGENNQGGFKHVKYLGNVYHIVPAEKGMKLNNGYIVTTGPKSKAKVIFNNGDHLFVAENTQYKIDWKRETATDKDPSVISLMRGAVRGLIQKDGPRSGMKVESKSTVMGVRGTDFHVSEKHGFLNVSVLRGEVEVVNENTNNKPLKIKTGQILTKETKGFSLNVITKEDLKQIAKESAIRETTLETKPEEAKELIQLEKSATEVTLGDIKEYQPQLYKEISEKNKSTDITSDSLALNTVKIMEEKAPSKIKPSESDLDDNLDPYDQYKFKKDK